jgi:hypothetical protein
MSKLENKIIPKKITSGVATAMQQFPKIKNALYNLTFCHFCPINRIK